MLQQKFIEHIATGHLLNKTDVLLIAISGGVDSVVLCELCSGAGFTFEIAHANFGLRGEESDADELFVREIAGKYRVPIHVRKFETAGYAKRNKVSVQVAARELRYGWFSEILQQSPMVLLTAHHADDNIETVLMNFFRGTGISGMRGMLPVTDKIVRPLLPFTKDQLIGFGREHQLVWREDSSNASDKYSRNYFRNTLIPTVCRIFPEAEKNVLENIKRFSDVEKLYYQAIDEYKKKLLEYRQNEVHVPVLKLKNAQPVKTIIFEIIRHYGFSSHQTDEVLHLLEAEQGKMVSSSTHRIFRNRKWLIISPVQSNEADHVLIREGEESVEFRDGHIEFKSTARSKQNIVVPDNEAVLDSRHLVFPMLLRRWKKGDYFYPLGLGKKKKVARFLIDQKLSPVQKENIWVLESEGRIIWIVGMRIDDRFKVGEGTRMVLRMKWVKT